MILLLPVSGSNKHPDVVLIKDDDVLIIDVAITFENGSKAFDEIREIKIKKYHHIASKLRKTKKYKTVSVEAVVVGAPGSWDPRNDRICHRLCTKKYTKLMRKLIVSDTLRSSRDIYYKHTTPPSRKPLSQPQRYQQFFNQIADALSTVPGCFLSCSCRPPPGDTVPALPSSVPFSSPTASANECNFNIEFAPENPSCSETVPTSTDFIPRTLVRALAKTVSAPLKTVNKTTGAIDTSCSFEQCTGEQSQPANGLPGSIAAASVDAINAFPPDGLPGLVAVASGDSIT